jgi:hypothetical protein
MGDERFRESGDYWKLTKDGKLQYDGKKDLYDESGKLIAKADPTKTNSENFSAWLGISVTDAKTMLASAWDETSGTYDSSKVINLSPEQKVKFAKLAGQQAVIGNATSKPTESKGSSKNSWLSSLWISAKNLFAGKKSEKAADQIKKQDEPKVATNYPAVDDSLKMQDFDPNKTTSLGGSNYTLGEQGCRLTADYRILRAAGVDTTPQLLAADKSNFYNKEGDFDDINVFSRNGLSLEGPIDSIEARLKTFVADGSQGWLYATVPFGNGTHTINLKNVTIDAAGKISFDPQGTSKSDRQRSFGVYSSKTPSYYQLSQLYIVTRNK